MRARRDGGTEGRRAALVLALILCAAAPLRLCAQTIDTIPKLSVPGYVRYGKWVALGGAVALGLRANALHRDANDTYQALQDRCFAQPLSCELNGNGRYTDPESERLYSATQRDDHQAARYLAGAEVSFALAAAGFVWELLERRDRTPNIPFEPRVEAGATATRVGISVRF